MMTDMGDGRTEKRTERADEEGVARFVERFASELTEAGMQRMPSRVFAALLVSEHGALNSVELAEQLRISPAAVSGAVRYLTQVGMIAREREPGSRRERYRLHSDQWYEMIVRREPVLARWEKALQSGIDAVGPDTAPGRRLVETSAFFEFLQKEMAAMMNRWREERERVLYEEGAAGGPG